MNEKITKYRFRFEKYGMIENGKEGGQMEQWESPLVEDWEAFLSSY